MPLISMATMVAILADNEVVAIEVRSFPGERKSYTPVDKDRKNIGIGLTDFMFKWLQANRFIAADCIPQADCSVYPFNNPFE